MYRMPFTGDFADVLFPPPLLVLPLFLMVFVMLLLVIHDSFLLKLSMAGLIETARPVLVAMFHAWRRKTCDREENPYRPRRL
jgi:hypothetical protein